MGDKGFLSLPVSILVCAKDSPSSFNQCSPPGADLAWVDLEPASYLCCGLLTFQCLKGYLSLKGGAVLLATLLHLLLLRAYFVILGAGTDLSYLSEILGPSHIVCVGEESDRRFIGEVLDANDVIRILHGPTAIGVSETPVPKRSLSLLQRIKGNGSNGKHFAASKAQIERAHNVLNRAFGELSIDCDYWDNGTTTYDANHVLGLFAGPVEEATEEIVEMMDNLLSERVPGAGSRKGTYPGRTSDTISITVIISNLGKGAAMDRIEMFYNEATRLMSEVRLNSMGREKCWEEAAKSAALLPDL